MSVHFTGPVWKLALPTSAKIVLLKFGDNANDDGYAWPSLPRVAKETSLGLSTVRDKVARFRRHGVLVLKKGGQGGRAAADYEDDSPGATCRYFIDLERAKDLYREGGPGWDYAPKEDEANPPGAGGLEDIHNPPDDAPNPPDETPNPPAPGIPPTPPYKDEPSSEPSSEPARARDPSAGGDGDARADQPSEGEQAAAAKAPWESLSRTRLVAAVAARRAERGSSMRLGSVTDRERAAADAYIAAVEAGEIEDKGGLAAPHAVDIWRGNIGRIRAVVGEQAYGAWIALLTPVSDDGETLELACPSAAFIGYVKENLGEAIEDILGRRIVLRVTVWAGAAAAKRKAEGGWAGARGEDRKRGMG